MSIWAGRALGRLAAAPDEERRLRALAAGAPASAEFDDLVGEGLVRARRHGRERTFEPSGFAVDLLGSLARCRWATWRNPDKDAYKAFFDSQPRLREAHRRVVEHLDSLSLVTPSLQSGSLAKLLIYRAFEGDEIPWEGAPVLVRAATAAAFAMHELAVHGGAAWRPDGLILWSTNRKWLAHIWTSERQAAHPLAGTRKVLSLFPKLSDPEPNLAYDWALESLARAGSTLHAGPVPFLSVADAQAIARDGARLVVGHPHVALLMGAVDEGGPGVRMAAVRERIGDLCPRLDEALGLALEAGVVEVAGRSGVHPLYRLSPAGVRSVEEARSSSTPAREAADLLYGRGAMEAISGLLDRPAEAALDDFAVLLEAASKPRGWLPWRQGGFARVLPHLESDDIAAALSGEGVASDEERRAAMSAAFAAFCFGSARRARGQRDIDLLRTMAGPAFATSVAERRGEHASHAWDGARAILEAHPDLAAPASQPDVKRALTLLRERIARLCGAPVAAPAPIEAPATPPSAIAAVPVRHMGKRPTVQPKPIPAQPAPDLRTLLQALRTDLSLMRQAGWSEEEIVAALRAEGVDASVGDLPDGPAAASGAAP